MISTQVFLLMIQVYTIVSDIGNVISQPDPVTDQFFWKHFIELANSNTAGGHLQTTDALLNSWPKIHTKYNDRKLYKAETPVSEIALNKDILFHLETNSLNLNSRPGKELNRPAIEDVVTNNIGFKVPIHRVERSTRIPTTPQTSQPISSGTQQYNQGLSPTEQFLSKVKFLESVYGGLDHIRQSPDAISFLFEGFPQNGAQTSLSSPFPTSSMTGNTRFFPRSGIKSSITESPSSMHNILQNQRSPSTSPVTNILPILMLSGGGEGLASNPLLLSQLMKNNQNKDQILQTLALTGSLEGVNPNLLTLLALNSQQQGSESNIIPLLTLLSGGENTNPLLLSYIMSNSNQQHENTNQPNSSNQFPHENRPSSGLNDIIPLLALSGGGENTNPLLLHSLLSNSQQNPGLSKILRTMALTGGAESPLMENPLLMYHISRTNEKGGQPGNQNTGGSSGSVILPLLMAGNESLSENPLLTLHMLNSRENGRSSQKEGQ